MYVAMPHLVFMDAMVSWLIHGRNIFHISQFEFCRLVGKGEDGPCGATLMLNLLMPFCSVPLLCVLSCTI